MSKPSFKKWPFQFKSKRPYIFPTRFAFGFAGLSILFLLIGFMYANNLLLLYLFFLVSMAIATIGWTHRNFEFSSVSSVSAEEFFASEESSLLVSLENVSRFRAFALSLAFRKNPEQKTWIPFLEPKGKTEIVFSTTFQKRGLQALPPFVLESRYPYGLFRCWRYFSLPVQVEVFPAKKGPHLPESLRPANAALSKERSDFMGHRNWNSSDSFRKIDWKIKARTGELMVQIHQEPQPQELVISWGKSAVAGDLESRLSQMSQWIFDAAGMQEPFKVQVEGVWESDWGRGHLHLKTCLSKLNSLFPPASGEKELS